MFTISSSEIFNAFKLKTMVLDIALENADSKMVRKEQLGITYLQLKESTAHRRQMLRILDLYETGTIQLFYDPTYPNIAPFIPFESTKVKGKQCIAINIAHHIEKNGIEETSGPDIQVTYKISPEKLRSLLFAGNAVLQASVTDGFRTYAVARDNLILLMATMWMKAVSRVSSIATNPDNAGHFRYVFAKWACCHIYNITDDDMTKGIATKIASVRDWDKTRAFDLKFSDEELRSYGVEDFITKVLRAEFPVFKMKNLDLPTVRNGMIYFGTINAMCVDYIPYVAAVCSSYQTDYILYGNKTLHTELKNEIKNAYINIAPIIDRRLGI